MNYPSSYKHLLLRISIVFHFIFLSSCTSLAWSGPTAPPPNNNAPEPINVSTSQQFKPGVIGANILNIYGSSQYLNFGNVTGAAGFGIRNNAGVLELKNSGGAWAPFATGASQWITAGSNIYYSSGNVAVGVGTAEQKLHVSSTATYQGIFINGNAAPSVGFAPASGGTPTWKIGIQGTNGARFAVSSGAGNTNIMSFEGSNVGIGYDAPGSAMLAVAGNVGIGTSAPSAKLTVGPSSGAAGNAFYDIGADKIAANTSVYSYGRVCAGNSAGNCLGSGGTVLRSDGVQFPDGTLQTTASSGGAGTLGCGVRSHGQMWSESGYTTPFPGNWDIPGVCSGNYIKQCLNGVISTISPVVTGCTGGSNYNSGA